LCPVRSACLAFVRGTQNRRPVRKPKAAVPHRIVGAAVLRSRGRVLIARRPEGRLLGGLWEFPGGKRERGESLAACVRRELKEELGITVTVGARVGVFRHAYTHYRVTVHAYACELKGGRPVARVHSAIRWVGLERLGEFPMGKVDRAIARNLQSADEARRAGASAAARRPAVIREGTRGATRSGR